MLIRSMVGVCLLVCITAYAQLPKGGGTGGGGGGSPFPNPRAVLPSSGTVLDIPHSLDAETREKVLVQCFTPARVGINQSGFTLSDPDATHVRVTFGSSQPSGTHCNLNASGTGIQGPTGAAGTPGAPGADSTVPGPPGADGQDGAPGSPGTDGRTVLSGASTPGAGTGANGDFFLRTDTMCMYGPKAAGAWPGSCSSLVGPQGSQGIQGIQGIPGNTGAQGPPGEVTEESLQTGRFNVCVVTTGSTDDYACSMNPAPTSYDAGGGCADGEICEGTSINLKPNVDSTGAATITIGSLGARSIKQSDGIADPIDSQLLAGGWYPLTYDGSVWRITGGGGAGGGGTVANDNSLGENQPILGGTTGTRIKAVTAAEFRETVDLEPGVDVQAQSAELQAVAGLNSIGLVTRSNASTYVTRTLQGVTNEICLTNPAGGPGNPVVAFCSDIDLTAKNRTKPIKSGTTPPVSCQDNEFFFDTDAPLGQGLLSCLSGIWTPQRGDPPGADQEIAINNSGVWQGRAVLDGFLLAPEGFQPDDSMMRIGYGPTPPGSCARTGLFWIDTDAPEGQKALYCNGTPGTYEQLASTVTSFEGRTGAITIQPGDVDVTEVADAASLVSVNTFADRQVFNIGHRNVCTTLPDPVANGYVACDSTDGKMAFRENGQWVKPTAVGGGVGSQTATINFAPIHAGECNARAMTFAGITVGTPIAHSLPATLEAGIVVTSRVSSADTVTLRACNIGADYTDPAAASFTVKVTNYHITGTSALDFPSMEDWTCSALTFTVTGAATGDPVVPIWPAAWDASFTGSMFVSAADTVTARVCNLRGDTYDPPSRTFGATIVK